MCVDNVTESKSWFVPFSLQHCMIETSFTSNSATLDSPSTSLWPLYQAYNPAERLIIVRDPKSEYRKTPAPRLSEHKVTRGSFIQESRSYRSNYLRAARPIKPQIRRSIVAVQPD